jgi:hypothetical protein
MGVDGGLEGMPHAGMLEYAIFRHSVTVEQMALTGEMGTTNSDRRQHANSGTFYFSATTTYSSK